MVDVMRNSEPSHINVRDIVKQIKTGEKTKPDAILELREVLKQSRSRPGVQSSDEINISYGDGSVLESSSRPVSSSADRTQFTRESRHAIISQIIEKKKQQRQLSKNPESVDKLQDEDADLVQEIKRQNSIDSTTPIRAATTAFPVAEYGSSDAINISPKDNHKEYWSSNNSNFEGSRERERPQSASRISNRTVVARQPDTRRSTDDNVIDSRNMRIMQYEQRLRNEVLKECTFQPKIKPLPAAYGALKEKDSPFLTRVSHWQREKEDSAMRRKSLSDRSEVVDCTFQPRINRVSSRAAREMRPVDTKESTTDRLYRASSEIAEIKAKFLEEERHRVAQLEAQECTFQPEIKTNPRKFQHVTPKFDRVRSEEPAPTSIILKECTFTPKVRGVRKSMDSAALYVSTNVVDRLTRQFGGSSHQQHNSGGTSEELGRNFDSDRPVMDMAAFMGNLGGVSNTLGGNSTTTPRSRPNSAPRERSISKPKVQLTEKEIQERHRNFEAFMHRNAQTEMRKKKHIGDTEAATAPKFTPELCRRSLVLSNSTNRGEFLERLERDNQRRLHEQNKKLHSASEDYTFNPELTRRAEKMRSRSSYELSRGDLLKRETSQRMLKLKMEQEELKKLTFQPKVSKKAHNIKSTLQLQEDPDGYLGRQAKIERDKEAYRSSIIRQREQSESAGCTFAPVTKDCPAYVKRIARSLSIVKSARLADAPPPKPEWR